MAVSLLAFLQYINLKNNIFYYILKQWTALLARSDWLLKLGIASAYSPPSKIGHLRAIIVIVDR